MVLIAGPKPFKAPAARQESFACRTGEQGSMYHICAVQCQIQLRRCKESDHNGRPAGRWRRCAAPSLRIPSAAASAACKTRLPLRSPGPSRPCRSRPPPGRPCRRWPEHRGLLVPGAVRCGRQVGRQADVAFEAAGENFAFDGFYDGVAGGGDPNAASRKLAFDIRHRFAVRPDDEADQVRNRMYRPRSRA